MVTRLVLFMVIIHLHQALNSPLRTARSPREFQVHQPLLLPHSVPVLQQNIYGKNTLLAPIQVTPLYIQPKLHVIPHNSFQHFNKDVRIPFTTQQRNYTYPHLLSILIPLHNIVTTGNLLVPLHDISVLPLRNNAHKGQYTSNGRVAMDKKDDEEEPSNQYRNFYGGYGNGLFFGGHGAGHGFYAYGK